MAYNKKNWQDNVSDITAAELNRMEQGIYDNSLVVDAVTNTLNPTDTETYKTAELTEGQITDVIGVNDILIKGQTSQDGEPTPSAPVDVNVVSGSNVIKLSSKNLLDGVSWTKDYALNENNTAFSANGWEYSDYVDVTNANYYYSSTTGVAPKTILYNNNKQVIKVLDVNSNTIYNISQYNAKYIRVSTATVGKSTTKVYEHQDKELPLDLPVENLFDKDNETYTNGYINGSSATTLSNSAYNRTLYISCKPNTTYAIQKMVSKNDSKFMIASSVDVPAVGVNIYNVLDAGANSTRAIYTTSNNAKYLLVNYMQTNVTSTTVAEMLNSIQIEQGSKVNAYTPFGTEPIELCKIGNYQDYFYKSGNKWYLHKEIEKIVANGSENWELSSGIYVLNRLSTNTHLANSTLISNLYEFITAGELQTKNYGIRAGNAVFLQVKNVDITSLENFKTFLSTNNLIVYYILQTATNTEITDTTLISQLEAIYNAPLYEQTNITQENNDLPMVLDITACKDNINGIKAFIRK